MSANQEYYTLGDIFRKGRAFLFYSFRKWPIILLGAIMGAGIGFALYSYQKPKYIAECTFIIEEKQGGLGGLSGIASQFGFDIGGVAGGGMFSGDNILEILRSKSILKRVLLSKVDSVNGGQTLADLYLDFSGLKRKWTSFPELESISFKNTTEVRNLSVNQDSVLNIVFEDLLRKHLSAERTSKKGTIISARVETGNPEFSRLLVERLVAGARDFYITAKTSIITSNVTRLQKKADSLSYLLSAKSYQVAQTQINDPNPALKMLQVPAEIASRDKTVLLTLYSEVVKNLEIAKTTLMLQTPALEVLDIPSLSLYDNKKGKLFYMAVGIFSLVAIALIVLFIVFMRREKKY